MQAEGHPSCGGPGSWVRCRMAPAPDQAIVGWEKADSSRCEERADGCPLRRSSVRPGQGAGTRSFPRAQSARTEKRGTEGLRQCWGPRSREETQGCT